MHDHGRDLEIYLPATMRHLQHDTHVVKALSASSARTSVLGLVCVYMHMHVRAVPAFLRGHGPTLFFFFFLGVAV